MESTHALTAVWLAALAVATAASPFAQALDPPRPDDFPPANPAAAQTILYEVQARSANACRTDTGSAAQRSACAAKPAPRVTYRAFGGDRSRCGILDDLERIRLGTLDDLTENTSDYRAGITLRYIHDQVGANTVWLMPVFPDNDRWNLPDPCDNLGSPYAVRDYLHVSGSLDRACIRAGLDENSTESGGANGCWGNAALDRLIAQAHQLGLKVMLDVAFNHFGHNYRFYDSASFTPVRERLARGEDPDTLWDFGATYEDALVHPAVLDSVAAIQQQGARDPLVQADFDAIRARCPALAGDLLVRAFHMWRVMLDWERARFSCSDPIYLEYAAPGFYLGARDGGEPHPSGGVGDNFTNNWQDVKFLYHPEYHSGNIDGRGDFYDVFVRNREYLFRVLNFWASRGIDGFRLDHTTDPDSGMGPNEWKYLTGKTRYYDWIRKGRPEGGSQLVFMAEEFGDQAGMNHVIDAMTDGYVGDLCARDGAVKDTSFVERVLSNDARFDTPGPVHHALVMRALETHDEKRLLDGTGFDIWTGAGFWGIGAASRGIPMLLMGQEFGESWGLGFRRSSILPSRFVGTANYQPQGDALAGFYRQMNSARQDPRNRALVSGNRWFLRARDTGAADPRIFAQAKWSDAGAPLSVVFAFHNLWPAQGTVEQSYFLPPELAGQLGIADAGSYRMVDLLTGQPVAPCQSGADLKWNLYVRLDASTRLQWLRLESCP